MSLEMRRREEEKEGDLFHTIAWRIASVSIASSPTILLLLLLLLRRTF
jgi:hypothetical protein